MRSCGLLERLPSGCGRVAVPVSVGSVRDVARGVVGSFGQLVVAVPFVVVFARALRSR